MVIKELEGTKVTARAKAIIKKNKEEARSTPSRSWSEIKKLAE